MACGRLGDAQGASDDLVQVDRPARRILLAQELTHPPGDLTGAQRLARDRLDATMQLGGIDAAGVEAAAHALGEVGDRAERLVHLVRQAGRHLAHGVQAQHMCQLGLVLARLLLGAHQLGDVLGEGGDAGDAVVLEHRGERDQQPALYAAQGDRLLDREAFAVEGALQVAEPARQDRGRHVVSQPIVARGRLADHVLDEARGGGVEGQ